MFISEEEKRKAKDDDDKRAAYLWRSKWRRTYPSLCRSPRSNSSDGRRSFRRAGYVSASRSIRLASPVPTKQKEKSQTFTYLFLLLSSLAQRPRDPMTKACNSTKKTTTKRQLTHARKKEVYVKPMRTTTRKERKKREDVIQEETHVSAVCPLLWCCRKLIASISIKLLGKVVGEGRRSGTFRGSSKRIFIIIKVAAYKLITSRDERIICTG